MKDDKPDTTGLNSGWITASSGNSGHFPPAPLSTCTWRNLMVASHCICRQRKQASWGMFVSIYLSSLSCFPPRVCALWSVVQRTMYGLLCSFMSEPMVSYWIEPSPALALSAALSLLYRHSLILDHRSGRHASFPPGWLPYSLKYVVLGCIE